MFVRPRADAREPHALGPLLNVGFGHCSPPCGYGLSYAWSPCESGAQAAYPVDLRVLPERGSGIGLVHHSDQLSTEICESLVSIGQVRYFLNRTAQKFTHRSGCRCRHVSRLLFWPAPACSSASRRSRPPRRRPTGSSPARSWPPTCASGRTAG